MKYRIRAIAWVAIAVLMDCLWRGAPGLSERGRVGDDDAASIGRGRSDQPLCGRTLRWHGRFQPGRAGALKPYGQWGRERRLPLPSWPPTEPSSGREPGARTALDRVTRIAVDRAGNVYAIGAFQNTVDFNPAAAGAFQPHLGSVNQNDAFLCKYDSKGTFLWARTWGGVYGDEAYDMAVDGAGNAYVRGRFLFSHP